MGRVSLVAESSEIGADGAGRDVQRACQVGDGRQCARRLGFVQEAQQAMAAQGNLALLSSLTGVYSPDDLRGILGGEATVGGHVGAGQQSQRR